ncbi:MAG: class I SAM-dependent methyltransferase [SAR324 cluster bacterium]|nr:class I SAM-dependent methyltransferase [SAR324 cluster bacterium]
MDKSLLVKMIGFPATLIHGDTLVLDRWLWLKKRLPQTNNQEKLLDIGCGTGAFTIGAALRGYYTLGLSWDERNQKVASERAKMCNADSASFEVLDVRKLDTRDDLKGVFDIAICFENIEHIINDRKLIQDIVTCLKPGGRLLLTTPYLLFRPITSGDNGPFSEVEDGGHVRRGYTKSMLEELCQHAGLVLERTSYCSGFISQKVTFLLRKLSGKHLLGWTLVLPLRILPPLFDWLITNTIHWPYFSICIEAYKPRGTVNNDRSVNTTKITEQKKEKRLG